MRLKQSDASPKAWQRFDGIYRTHIEKWIRQAGVPSDDVEDLTQNVLLVVNRELAQFDHRGAGAFRSWLKAITVNRLRAFWKERKRRLPRIRRADESEQFLAQLEDPNSDLSKQWNEDHEKHVLHKLLAIVRPDFEETTWNAFQRFALDGLPAAQVAGEIGMSLNAVLLAKSRIMKRLREEADGLID
jgi:RNA polymerase sigma-70 factor (ECF subfamily)